MQDKTVGLTIVGGKELTGDSKVRQRILDLEAVMTADTENFTTDGDSVAPVNHYLCEGNYAREIFITADTVVIGKIHRHEHINVISQGKCMVVTEEGRELLEAPLTFISKPHIKRAVYAIEDTVWTTIHPTNSTDLDEIESEVIAPSYADLNNALEHKND